MSAANTAECILQFRGKKLVGVLFYALPSTNADIAGRTITLVFDDGTGLSFSGVDSRPSFWAERREDVESGTNRLIAQLEASGAKIRELLELRGKP